MLTLARKAGLNMAAAKPELPLLDLCLSGAGINISQVTAAIPGWWEYAAADILPLRQRRKAELATAAAPA